MLLCKYTYLLNRTKPDKSVTLHFEVHAHASLTNKFLLQIATRACVLHR